MVHRPRWLHGDACPGSTDHSAFHRRHHLVGVLLGVLLAGCDRGEVSLLQPEGPGSGDNVLELSASFAEGTGLSAETFGWSKGVPQAEVTLLRVRDHQPIVRTDGGTDAAGSVQFDGLLGGLQWVTLFRRLEGAEEEALPAEWPVAVLAGGGKVPVNGATDTTLIMRPPRLGTMVISEVATATPPGWEMGGSYYGNIYLELYNNGAETTYLDGMLLGKGYRGYIDASRYGHHACVDSEPMRVDPAGFWAAWFWRFPGTGNEYPVAPGQAVVIAASATDHRAVHPTMFDLTHADFEFRSSDLTYADNPAAPNMNDVGPEQWVHQLFFVTSGLWFLAAPTELESLPRLKDPAVGTGLGQYEHVRIPRERILDVAHIWRDNATAYTQIGGLPICRDPVNPAYDAVPGGFDTGEVWDHSAQRRAVRTRDGRVILLDTDVSAIDFELRAKTPGWVPEVEW